MAKRLTQKEAEDKSFLVGIELVGKYIGSKTKTTFKCPKCNNLFLDTPIRVWSNLVEKCKYCYLPKVGDVFEKLTIIKIYPSKSHGGKLDALCICGKIWHGKIAHVLSGNTKSCGCYTKEFQRGLRKDLSGKTIGDIEVIRFSHYTFDKRSNRMPWYLCRCICGQYTTICAGNIKNQNRCGKCRKKRNGQTVSQKQLDLHKIIKRNGILNYKIYLSNRPSYIDIAFILNNNKIAVEYDEWVWHGNKLKKDSQRMQKLIRRNWKVLRIKAHDNLPTKQQLDKAIHKLAYTKRKQYTITLDGWGIGKTRFS
jgi:very-short-patch-repair endonuclease